MSKIARHREPIAIVGVSGLFPGSVGTHGFWADILRGRDLLKDVPASHWLLSDYYDPNPLARDKTYANRGAFLEDVEFDPMAWGVPPSALPATDTSQLLALIVAQRVLEDAGRGDLGKINRDRTSVILGITSAQELLGTLVSRLQRPVWSKALREMGLPESEIDEACERIASHYVEWQESSFPGVLGNVVAGRIANRLDLGGTNCVCDAACASSFSALAMGVNELQLGDSDVVITGGVDTMNDIFMYMCFSKTPALSRTGDCRPFSDKADGTMLGEGIAMVAMKRLSDAEAAGDPIYAVIRGVGSASDGRATSVYAPLPGGQAKALRRAYEQAGYGADTVELVEAHGTGTMAGDAAEVTGLKMVFEDTDRFRKGDRQFVALGSVKSQIGHTKSAAGAAGLFKAVMALHHKVLPPTIKIDRPSPKLDIENSPFHLATRTRPWLRDGTHPRRASVSAFGFGGSNFHVALEEYVGESKAPKVRTAKSELVLASGSDPKALGEAAKALASEIRASLAAARDTSIENEARVLQVFAERTQKSFVVAPARLAIVAESATELANKLEEAAAQLPRDGFLATPKGIFAAHGTPERDVCFVFPGQGSQYVRMGESLAMTFDEARSQWDRATTVTPGLGDVVFPRSSFAADAEEKAQAQVTKTEWAQPAIGAASLATAALLSKLGLEPVATCGHSFGEISALCAAGVLTADDALRIARARGERMAEAARLPGAMTAVIASRTDVEALGLAHVSVANHNAPNEVVISGGTEAIAQAEKVLAERGLKHKRLGVATAFHSPIVASAVEPFAAFLRDIPFAAPKVDVIGNGTALPYGGDADAMRMQLATQLAGPVRFVESIEAIYARGVRTFVEVGPGAVLTGLVDRILEGKPHHAVATDRKGKDALTAFHEALGKLAVLGVQLDFAALWAEYASAVDPRSVPVPKMALKLNGSNYGKYHPANPVGAKSPKALPPNGPRRPAQPPTGSNGSTVHGQVPAVVAAAPPVRRDTSPTPTTSSTPGTVMSTRKESSAPVSHVAPAPVHAAPLSGDVQLAWVAAYQEAQRQTAEAHAAYQRAMAETHQAFLRTAETSFTGLAAMLTGGRIEASAPAPRATPIAIPPAPAPAPSPVFAPAPAPMVVAPAPVAAPAAVAPAPLAAVVSGAPAALEQTMLEIVALKTGYPVDMLGADMDLEADLGVDSIKRVEILAALRARTANLPELDMAKLASLRTLAQITAHVREVMGGSAPTPGPALAAPAAKNNGSNGTNGTSRGNGVPADLEQTMLEIVALKTGYPVDMLGADMDLEADLGVDSIKRVEILAALRERTSNLPELDMAKLASLRTLAQITAHVKEVMGGGGPQPVAAAPALPRLSAGVSGGPSGTARWVTAVVPAPARGLALSGLLSSKRCVVTDDQHGLAALVVARLQAHGIAAEVVAEAPSDADALIDLVGLRPDSSDRAAVMELPRLALANARSVAKGMTDRGGVYVVVQDTGGDFGFSGSDRAWLGGLTGLLKTAAQEWPKCSARAIDLQSADRTLDARADALVSELLFGGHELEVGLRADGTRLTVTSQGIPVSPTRKITDVVSPDDVIVVSGGARGVTAACVLALVRATRCRVVILARTALAEEPTCVHGVDGDGPLKQALLADARARGEKLTPPELGARVALVVGNREIRDVLAQIGAAGGDVRYEAVDVTDAAGVSRVLAAARTQWGPIAGLIHGAGVIADKLIAEKTDAQLERVLSTKVRGLQALLAATEHDPLKLVVLFSSVAGRAGNRGQCDYAMANEILNKVACAEQQKRLPGSTRACVFKSLGWGPWEAGMVNPVLRAHFEKAGVPLVTLDGGPRAMLDEIAAGGPVDVVLGAEPKPEALVGEGGARSLCVDVLVDAGSAPYLADHRVKGAAVVPIVLAIEWLARAAEALCPGKVFVEASELRVLRGIKLAHYGTGADRFTIRVSTRDGETIAGEVLGEGSVLHYGAKIRVAASRAEAREKARPPAALNGVKTPWAGALYGDALFHGPAFQVICQDNQRTPVLSRDGIEGDLGGVRTKAWPGAFITDPALLDGALQLAITFCKAATGGSSLPTAVARVRWLADGPQEGVLRCAVRSKVLSRDHTTSEMVIFRGDTVVAEISGAELHVLPGTHTAPSLLEEGPEELHTSP